MPITKRHRHPLLPLLPDHATPIGLAAGILENDQGGAVFLGGQASYCWGPDDEFSRRLAAVQLMEMKTALAEEIATAFKVDRATLWRWRHTRQRHGWEALLRSTRPGPKGPSKVTPEMTARIQALDAEGKSLAQIAAAVGVSTFSVRRALGRVGTSSPPTPQAGPEPEPAAEATPPQPGPATQMEVEAGLEAALSFDDLPAVPAPALRREERRLARAGELAQAAPVFTEGRQLPLLGLLLILPALAETGLLEAAGKVYGRLSNGFYGLRSLLLMLVFQALLREPRAEGAARLSPIDLGRLLALDRAPEVKTIRRRLNEVAGKGHEAAAELLRELARRHAQGRPEAVGFLYLDGHVTVYSGKRRLPKAHVSRLRISAPASEDLWVSDAHGHPVFVVAQPPGSSMVKEIRALLPELKELAQGRRVTICFDRGGWSPKLFSDIVEAGFDFITYRKGKARPLPSSDFQEMAAEVEGQQVRFKLAERTAQLQVGKGKPELTVREVVRLKDDHQTVIVTSRADLNAVELAFRQFSRWRQENWFKYGRANFALDALDSYAVIEDDPQRLVPNPAKARHQKEFDKARATLTELNAQLGQGGLGAQRRGLLRSDRDVARAEVGVLECVVAQAPGKVPLGQVEPEARLLAPERRLLAHAVRLSTFNAESALARLLSPFYRRAQDEARALLREAFKVSGDLRVLNGRLEVCLNPLSAPRRTAALARLCEVLSATETAYPGTNLVIRYSLKSPG